MSKRESLITGFLELAAQRGIAAAGVDTIAAHTGVSKKTIYNNFGSKEALAIESLVKFSKDVQSVWASEWQTITNRNDLLLARFTELENLIKSGGFYGCIFINTAKEYPDHHHQLHVIATAHKQASLAETSKRLAMLQLDGSSTAVHIELLYEGLISKLLVEQDLSLVAQTKQIIISILADKSL
ncbi:MAG: TetR family transcriptional regulator [Gammaproteobacteria bacterium]|nr:TetR family transcriptional regulator [Gammaproteobacteria bacterium]